MMLLTKLWKFLNAPLVLVIVALLLLPVPLVGSYWLMNRQLWKHYGSGSPVYARRYEDARDHLHFSNFEFVGTDGPALVGKVTNNSKQFIHALQLELWLRDASGKLIGRCYGQALGEFLKPNESEPFTASLPAIKTWDWEEHLNDHSAKVEIIAKSFSLVGED